MIFSLQSIVLTELEADAPSNSLMKGLNAGMGLLHTHTHTHTQQNANLQSVPIKT